MDNDKIFDEVREVDLKKTMETSYIDYAMSVIAARRPRALSSRPRDAAVMPFPKPDTTPPVTKMYLLILSSPSANHGFLLRRSARPPGP